MKTQIYNECISLINNNLKEDNFEIAKKCSFLLNNPDTKNEGQDIVIRILDKFDSLSDDSKTLWLEYVEFCGLYPYLNGDDLMISSLIRKECHMSKYLNFYLHKWQFVLSQELDIGNSIIVSAPTSFGKSILIKEIIASGKHKNIVIIQPTLALLDETRKNLLEYKNIYNIVVSTRQNYSYNSNIFLLTAERVIEYPKFPKIDFFIIDEFYKLSIERDDERAPILNLALYKLLKMTNKFYFLGPNIKKISEGFAEKYNAKWFRSNYSTVAVDINKTFESFKNLSREDKKEAKKKKLFELLKTIKGQSIIYCSSPAKANVLSYEYYKYINKNENNNHNKDIIEWIEQNIHKDWFLKFCLKNKIGVHHGAFPRHLTSSIVDLFNKSDLEYLFCTSTLIEGVNTSAKNVVLFDKMKGKKPIDYFDYMNIIGRGGRMKMHYVGNIYQLEDNPEPKDIDVEIPLFEQNKAPLELLVQLDEEDLNSKLTKTKKNELEKIKQRDKNLFDVIRKNAGISIDGQLKIVNKIENNLQEYSITLVWNEIPNYLQLSTVIELTWNYLLKSSDKSKGARSAKQLAVYALQYFNCKSLKALISNNILNKHFIELYPDEEERTQIVIQDMLLVLRNWFDYKLPKMLVTISNLQQYVFQKYNLPYGDYSFFSTQIENFFLSGNLHILLDYDIPASALKKLENKLDSSKDVTEIIKQIKEIDLSKTDLISYEKNKILEIIK